MIDCIVNRFILHALLLTGCLFLLDATLSVADEALHSLFGVTALCTVRQLVALPTLLLTTLLYVLLLPTAWFRRPQVVLLLGYLPFIVVLHPTISNLVLLDVPALDRLTMTRSTMVRLVPMTAVVDALFPLLQLAIAVWFLLYVRSLQRSRWDFAVPEDMATTPTTVKRALLLYGGHALVVPPVLAVLLVCNIGSVVYSFNGGFLRPTRQGLAVVQRELRRGDTTVVLVPMIHIGGQKFYRDLNADLMHDDTVILLEGVTDRAKKIPAKGASRYVAKLIGTADQSEFRPDLQAKQMPVEERPRTFDVRRADLDVADFGEDTVRFIGIMESISKGGVDVLASILRMTDFTTNERTMRAVFGDIIDKRNAHLVTCVLAVEEDFTRIVVPWGAGHMPGIQRELEELGFTVTDETLRYVWRFD